MLTYEKAIRSPKTFQAITGMTRPQFDLLYAVVDKKYDEAKATKLSKRPRKRSIGAGRRFALSLQNRLLLLLFYYMHRLSAGWCSTWARPPCQGTYRILRRW